MTASLVALMLVLPTRMALASPRGQDHATWDDARRYATGFRYVLVNGRVAIDDGRFTGVRAGRVLLRE